METTHGLHRFSAEAVPPGAGEAEVRGLPSQTLLGAQGRTLLQKAFEGPSG